LAARSSAIGSRKALTGVSVVVGGSHWLQFGCVFSLTAAIAADLAGSHFRLRSANLSVLYKFGQNFAVDKIFFLLPLSGRYELDLRYEFE
jgi:hypothetical protein